MIEKNKIEVISYQFTLAPDEVKDLISDLEELDGAQGLATLTENSRKIMNDLKFLL